MINLASVGAVVAVILGVIALYFKGQADKSGTEAVVAKTEGEDAPLAQQQADNQVKLSQINKDIQDLKDEKKRLRDQYLTDQQEADKWNTPKS